MRGMELLKRNSAKIQTSLSTIVKIILIFSIFYSTYYHLWHILFADTLLLTLTFLPYILKKTYELKLPREIEFIILMFAILTFFLGDRSGILVQIFFGLVLGFVGFIIMSILFLNSKLKANYSMIILFSFSFSVSLAMVAEIAKYYLKLLFKFNIAVADYHYAILNLTLVSIGAFLSSVIGYSYVKGWRVKMMDKMVERIKNHNPNLFIDKTDSPEEILKLIEKGENEKIEFKSTLRANLHTGEHDRKVENASLKTLVAFLNSEGGTLLIGVNDKGDIIGLEKDGFENNDKFNRHFTNLVKERIGNEYLPYMQFEIIIIEGKSVLKIHCFKSDKPVFLKFESNEEFYIRVGASSLLLIGNKLLEYIHHKFKN
ncbi:MAG: ATP-binding protein [Candidatus Pacearchaeota archaeon]|jgi:hypothetical protein